ncbi:hypothetical protein SELMODRAFT_110980 [Selaginella moellendorffii]|uniref:Pentacotripeptide-repeat region of PRORP domain-containing protein n=1 Tax=Selaginella moellendorffii TaxID=88036 RepID=D8S7X1_SELML|nr:hypothetical protein SELMODRAFT_110980 [Selaginella moellendorffii]
MRRTLLSIKDGLERLETIQVGGSSLYASLIQCCGAAKAIEEGRRVHRHLLRYGYGGNTFLGNLLIQMYRQCGSMEEARSTFDSMAKKDVVSWNAMVSGYSQAGQGREALDLYQRMDSEGVEPNRVTLLGVLGACGNSQLLAEGRSVHSRIRSSRRESDLSLEAALVTMYARCGSLQEAEKVFDGISRKNNLVSWTAMIVGFAKHGHAEEAMEMYRRMELDGAEPDDVTFITILVACSHSGLISSGHECFTSMAAEWEIAPRMDHFVCLVDLLGRAGWLDQAQELVETMPFEPEPLAWTTLLGACKIHHDFDRARVLEELVLERTPQECGSSHVLLSNIYVES